MSRVTEPAPERTLETDGPSETMVHTGAPYREPTEIVRSIVDETQMLFQKHLELAQQELVEAVEARIKGALAGAVAGVVSLFALGFLASAAAFALDNVMPPWGSRLIVGGAFLLLAAVGGLVAARKMSHPPMAPEETKRMLKEDAEWARAQLRR